MAAKRQKGRDVWRHIRYVLRYLCTVTSHVFASAINLMLCEPHTYKRHNLLPVRPKPGL
jgi:hypothetical protein